MILILIVAALFGVVQGLTELLPISSSAHLYLLHQVITIVDVDGLSFDAALHIGTLLALFVYFAKDIRDLIIAFFSSISKRSIASVPHAKMAWLIILGSIPAAVAGYFGEKVLEEVFRNVLAIAATLTIGGLLFLLVERYGKKTRDEHSLGVLDVVVIGLAQMFALIPGISRSGITIVAGMARDLTRTAAARFSFLLSLPVVAGAGIKKTFDLVGSGISQTDIVMVIVGIVFATIFGILAIRWLLVITQKYSLRFFAWYRFGLAFIVTVIYFIAK
jgi:undecaprenyl-diphosphatase